MAERGGVLDDSLRLVAEELERRVEIRGKVRRALAYPATVLVVGLTVALFVLAYVVPEFTVIFQDQHVELPLLTRCGDGYGILCRPLLVAVFARGHRLGPALDLLYSYAAGRLVWDRLKLRFPLVGDLLRKASILRFAQTLGTLLRGGVPILVSLKLVQEHAENSVLASELAHVYAAVDQGSRLEVPLRQSTVFHPQPST